ncbi:MAG: alpha/beta hydrolase fold domain-containing protein [Ferruginibacter sp.]
MKRIVLFSITTLLFFSCKKSNTDLIITELVPPIAASTQLNASYGADPLQKMDIYLPAGRTTTSTKLIIMVHGGAWYGGDKSDITAFVDTLKKRLPNYAIININYRLATTPLTTFPTQENDVKSAVDFIYGKKSEYNISDKFAMIGVSAGAHLALLHAYKYSNSVKVKAVVDFFGPTDMTDMYNSPASPLAPSSDIALLFNGATPTTNATLYTQSSPITFANAQAVPTIILHGGQDPIVRVTQATNLRDKLISFNIPQQYVFYPTEGHGWAGALLTDSFDKIQAFLTQYVQ